MLSLALAAALTAFPSDVPHQGWLLAQSDAPVTIDAPAAPEAPKKSLGELREERAQLVRDTPSRVGPILGLVVGIPGTIAGFIATIVGIFLAGFQVASAAYGVPYLVGGGVFFVGGIVLAAWGGSALRRVNAERETYAGKIQRLDEQIALQEAAPPPPPPAP
jgi:hypothetical protein